MSLFPNIENISKPTKYSVKACPLLRGFNVSVTGTKEWVMVTAYLQATESRNETSGLTHSLPSFYKLLTQN